MNILIVDDKKELCDILEDFLNELNFYKIDKVYNGLEALKKIEEKKYDLMISDIKMPIMDGIELVKNIKKLNISLHIILISGQSDLIESLQNRNLGKYDFLIKPIDTKKLTEILKSIWVF